MAKRLKRNSDGEKLDSVVNKFIKSYGYSSKFNEFEVIQAFSEIMGPIIMKKIKNAYMYNKILYFELTSATLRNELTMQKTKIIKLINDHIGAKDSDIVSNIIFK